MKIILAMMAFLAVATELKAVDAGVGDDDISLSKPAVSVQSGNNDGKLYEFTLSPTVKKAIIGTGITIGIGLAWYYGVPLLYNLGYKAASVAAPTQGWGYYLWGSQAYCHAGMTCANSTAAHVTLNAAGASVGGAAAGLGAEAYEGFATKVGRLFW